MNATERYKERNQLVWFCVGFYVKQHNLNHTNIGGGQPQGAPPKVFRVIRVVGKMVEKANQLIYIYRVYID